MKKWIDRYCRFLAMIMALLLAIMVVLVFGNVVLRYGLNSGITISEELSRWLFVWLTFMGAVVALHEKAHMSMGEVASALPPSIQRIVRIVVLLLMLWVTWLIFSGSLSQTQINLENYAPVTGLSQGWFYGVGIFFAVSTGVILLTDLWEAIRNMNAPLPPPHSNSHAE
ncbi:TRAP transporter small permease [Thiofilum flexile]|uniref:TRAP transporter small permease n=1 Tax=Thiofilum flexile TaxID=125627 RepID=UPI0003A59A49|nr:TRAP transporter small permease [Thiofilum flexile]